jgi:hypothetical protein
MSVPAQVLCMKWGTKFGPEYVNRLHGMVRRHLRRPFRFVCLTDDGAGFHADIEVLPLPEMGWTDGITEHGWWKVGLFSERLGDLSGPALFLDLDVLVVDSLEPLFDHPGEVMVPRDYRRLRVRGDSFVGNTSVLRFPVGKYPEVMEGFREDFPGIRKRLRNEQEYVSHFFHERGLLAHWPSEWCPSFKRHCVSPWPLSHVRTPRLTRGAKVVVFHGRPNPGEALEGQGGKWYRPILPTPWIADHWHDD